MFNYKSMDPKSMDPTTHELWQILQDACIRYRADKDANPNKYRPADLALTNCHYARGYSDRRYRVFVDAASMGEYVTSGIIRFRGFRYYVVMCPTEQRITLERM